ncbi:hypothetical protein P9273_21345 [Mesorhizobium sp. WSM4935]|uniref:hypothetical protein n=1 Tax=Mesorhizobium sp. WSM4935 TaxID=3038547 RepID=UPI0024151174|nr:hypothetical protein [Mesorhizobium sp. WSM4935]MDG4877651.1 hypothetical protein [Mesorhizobium sp. WSM4935]
MLAEAVSRYCSSHRIEHTDDRETVAIKVMGLFQVGLTEAGQILQELERTGRLTA